MTDMQDEILEIGEDTQKDKYLIFSLGNEEYGIGISYVTEIVGIQKITEIPEVEEYIKGIINLRGNVIPVIDVRLMLDLKKRNTMTGPVLSCSMSKEFPLALLLIQFRKFCKYAMIT